MPRCPVSPVEQPIDARGDAHDIKAAAGSRSRSPRADTDHRHSSAPDAARSRSRSMSRGQSPGRRPPKSQAATHDRQLPAPQADDGPRAPSADGAFPTAVEPSLLSAAKGPQPAGDFACAGQAEQAAADAASSGLSTSTTTSSSASGSSSASSSSSSAPSAASPATLSGDGPPGIDPAVTSSVLVQPTIPDEPAAAETGSASRSAAAPAAAACAPALPCSNGGSSPATAAVAPARRERLAPEKAASGPAAAAAATAASVEPHFADAEHVRQRLAPTAPATAAALLPTVTAEAHVQAASAPRDGADIITDRQSAAEGAAAAKQAARDQVAEAGTLQSMPDAPPATEAGPKRKRAPIVWTASLTAATSAVPPAAAVPSRAVAAAGGARTEPFKKRACEEAAVSGAVAPSGATGAGTAATAAAAITLPPHLNGASARTAKSTRLSAGGGAAAATQPAGHAMRGKASDIAAAPAEETTVPHAAATIAGLDAAAGAADGQKPPRVSALRRLGRTVEAVTDPAKSAAPAVRDASERLQRRLMPASTVSASRTVARFWVESSGRHAKKCAHDQCCSSHGACVEDHRSLTSLQQGRALSTALSAKPL